MSKAHSDMAILLGMCMELVDATTVCCSGRKKTMIPSPVKTGRYLMHHYNNFWVVSLFFVCEFLWASKDPNNILFPPHEPSWVLQEEETEMLLLSVASSNILIRPIYLSLCSSPSQMWSLWERLEGHRWRCGSQNLSYAMAKKV